MHTETAHETVAIRLDRREAALVEKAVQQTGRPQTDQAAFLIRAAIREARTVLKKNTNHPGTTPSR